MSEFNAEKKFIELRTAFKKEAMRLISIIKLYRHIHERKADRLEEMNVAPAFFGYVLDSFFTTIIIWTHKMLNIKESDEFSIPKLLNFAEQNIDVFSIKALKKRRQFDNEHWLLSELEPLTVKTINEERIIIDNLRCLESIKLRRDKFHAHFDKKYFTNPKLLQKEAPLIWNDLDKIVEVITDIYNRYSGLFDGNIQEFVAINLFDVDDVLDILHKHKTGIKELYGERGFSDNA